ncbi:hypothetical protein GQ53DRAFT_817697 [Thozetella sp. PMI_491]|nr:hypothetical protein GQ53DRAFT_817697 [Thozetella sp. PMI_491]
MAQRAFLSSLPVEVQAQIVEYLIAAALDSESIAELASVSLIWQDLVERHTFADLRLNQDRVVDAYEILTPRRQALVRRIYIDVVLEEYGEEYYGLTETAEEQGVNNTIFAQAIENLVLLLSLWEDPEPVGTSGAPPTGLALYLDVFSPSDWGHGELWKSHDREYIDQRQRMREEGTDIADGRFIGSFLVIDEDDIAGLPDLPAVMNFSLSVTIARGIAPRVCFALAAKMPNLEVASWQLRDPLEGDPRLQRETLADCLLLLPSSLREFWLGYDGAVTQNIARDELQNSAPDTLSIAFRHLSQRLTKLTIRGAVLGMEVFWPSAGEARNDTTLAWPYLEHMHLRLREHGPDGGRLFQFSRHAQNSLRRTHGGEDDADEDESDTEEAEVPEESFWAKPVGERVDTYYIAAAHAMARMPRLKNLSILWLYSGFYGMNFFSRDGSNPYLWVRSEIESQLSDEVEEAWLAAARAHTGINHLEIGVGPDQQPPFARPYLSNVLWNRPQRIQA